MLIILLTSIFNASNHELFSGSLTNQQCLIRPTRINLHPNQCTQGLRYYPFVVNLDKFTGGCNTVNDLSNRMRVPNKTKDLY